jgi:hypothetical protein
VQQNATAEHYWFHCITITTITITITTTTITTTRPYNGQAALESLLPKQNLTPAQCRKHTRQIRG